MQINEHPDFVGYFSKKKGRWKIPAASGGVEMFVGTSNVPNVKFFQPDFIVKNNFPLAGAPIRIDDNQVIASQVWKKYPH